MGTACSGALVAPVSRALSRDSFQIRKHRAISAIPKSRPLLGFNKKPYIGVPVVPNHPGASRGVSLRVASHSAKVSRVVPRCPAGVLPYPRFLANPAPARYTRFIQSLSTGLCTEFAAVRSGIPGMNERARGQRQRVGDALVPGDVRRARQAQAHDFERAPAVEGVNRGIACDGIAFAPGQFACKGVSFESLSIHAITSPVLHMRRLPMKNHFGPLPSLVMRYSRDRGTDVKATTSSTVRFGLCFSSEGISGTRGRDNLRGRPPCACFFLPAMCSPSKVRRV